LKKHLDLKKQKINIKEISEKNRKMESSCTTGWATTYQTAEGFGVCGAC
jgi:hypothetical protein